MPVVPAWQRAKEEPMGNEHVEHIRFRPGDLLEPILQRVDPAYRDRTNAGASATARRDLSRYYALLRVALASVDLTEAEARFLVATYNGTATTVFDDEGFLQLLAIMPTEIADALRDPPIDLDGIDPLALHTKVAAWSLAQRAAVLDAIERCWNAVTRGDADGDLDAIMRTVGLIKWEG